MSNFTRNTDINYAAFNATVFKKALEKAIEKIESEENVNYRKALAQILVQTCLENKREILSVKKEKIEEGVDKPLVLHTADVTDFFFVDEKGNEIFSSDEKSQKKILDELGELFNTIEKFHNKAVKKRKKPKITSFLSIDYVNTINSISKNLGIGENFRIDKVLEDLKNGKRGFRICENSDDGEYHIEKKDVRIEPADEKTNGWMMENAKEANGEIIKKLLSLFFKKYLHDRYMAFLDERDLFGAKGGFTALYEKKKEFMENELIFKDVREKTSNVLGAYFYPIHPFALKPAPNGDVEKYDENMAYEYSLSIKQNNPVNNMDYSLLRYGKKIANSQNGDPHTKTETSFVERTYKAITGNNGDNVAYHKFKIAVLSYAFRDLFGEILSVFKEGDDFKDEIDKGKYAELKEKMAKLKRECDFVANYRMDAFIANLFALSFFFYDVGEKARERIVEKFFDIMNKSIVSLYGISFAGLFSKVMDEDGFASVPDLKMLQSIMDYYETVYEAIVSALKKNASADIRFDKEKTELAVEEFIENFVVEPKDFSFVEGDDEFRIEEEHCDDYLNVKVSVIGRKIYFMPHSTKEYALVPIDKENPKRIVIVIVNVYSNGSRLKGDFLPENLEKKGIYPVFDPYIFDEIKRARDIYGEEYSTESVAVNTALKIASYFYYLTMIYPIVYLYKYNQFNTKRKEKYDTFDIYSLELFSKKENDETNDLLAEIYSMGRLFMSDLRYFMGRYKTKGLYSPTLLKGAWDRSISIRAKHSFYSLLKESGEFETNEVYPKRSSIIGTFYPIHLSSYKYDDDEKRRIVYSSSGEKSAKYFLFFKVDTDGNVIEKSKGFLKESYESVAKTVIKGNTALFCKSGFHMNKHVFSTYFKPKNQENSATFFVNSFRTKFTKGYGNGNQTSLKTKDYVINEFVKNEEGETYMRTRVVRDDGIVAKGETVNKNFSTMLQFEPHEDCAFIYGDGGKESVNKKLEEMLYPLFVHVNNKIYNDESSVSLAFFTEVHDSSLMRSDSTNLKYELRSVGQGAGSSPIASLFLKNFVVMDRMVKTIEKIIFNRVEKRSVK